MLELNFIGIDETLSAPDETYVRPDPHLPLLVFGSLSLLLPSREIVVEGQSFRVSATSGLILEKLISDRTGRKGDRDLLVPSTRSLDERARKRKQRLEVRAWHYRQRDLAAGLWDKVRLVLARSEYAYEITEDRIASLLSLEGALDPLGDKVSPKKSLVVLPPSEGVAQALKGAKKIRVGLGQDFLNATCVALVMFPT